MYTETTRAFGDYQIIQLTNNDTGEYFSIIPELGGRVHEICLRKGEELFQVLDNEKDPNAFKEERWYRGVILVPFPNRVRDGEYEFLSEKYLLEKNMPGEGHAIHGIMYNKKFTLANNGPSDSGEIMLRHEYDGSDAGYPFPCIVTYTFNISGKGFRCTVTVENKGSTALPLGVGWHPYFTLGCPVDELLLQTPKVGTLFVDERMIPTGETEEMSDYVTPEQIYDTNFDTGFVIEEDEGVSRTRITNTTKSVSLELWQSEEFPYVQIFTPPGRESVALEPMTCPADAFNSKEGLIELAPGGTWSGNFGVMLS